MGLTGYELEIRSIETTDGVPGLLLDEQSIDGLLHRRMLDYLRPFACNFPHASWLTIGDEGQDAWMLRQYGAAAVTASSLSDARLLHLAKLGYLEGIEICALNAENLDLPDSSFDFIVCRQAYHHVRRAPKAFYEFMRVARIAFILIEPFEGYRSRPFDWVRTCAKMILRRRGPEYDLFEPVGNFIYRISERDMFRMLAAVQLPFFGVKLFNNFYVSWLARQDLSSRLSRALLYCGIKLQDALCFLRLMNPGLCVAVVPTGQRGEELTALLQASRFRIVRIPKNPYLSAEAP